jgi:hypothetical protein
MKTKIENNVCGRKLAKGIMSALLLLIIATFGMSNVAKAQCPPDDGKGTWAEIVKTIPVYVYGTTVEVTYKFCYRINWLTGHREVYISEVNYPDYPYTDVGDGWSSFDLAYFYNLCIEHLSDNIWDIGIPGFYKESIVFFENNQPAVIVEFGHHACVVQYTTFDVLKGATIAAIAHCEMYVTLAPDCMTTYEYCWELVCCRYNPNTGADEEYPAIKKTKTYSGPINGVIPGPCPSNCTIDYIKPDGSSGSITVTPEFICE